jgi:hypothetical protein
VLFQGVGGFVDRADASSARHCKSTAFSLQTH